jgi:hypothetical protein
MLTAFIIVSFICWILGFFINGFTLYSVSLIIPTLMFSARKTGIHVKFGNIVATEILLLFFSLVWRCIFGKFNLIRLLLSIVVRAVFLIICIYDDTVFVYVNEERKRI